MRGRLSVAQFALSVHESRVARKLTLDRYAKLNLPKDLKLARAVITHVVTLNNIIRGEANFMVGSKSQGQLKRVAVPLHVPLAVERASTAVCKDCAKLCQTTWYTIPPGVDDTSRTAEENAFLTVVLSCHSLACDTTRIPVTHVLS